MFAKLLNGLGGILKYSGAAAGAILFGYYDYMFLCESWLSLLNPFIYLQVMYLMIITPAAWIMVAVSVIGAGMQVIADVID